MFRSLTLAVAAVTGSATNGVRATREHSAAGMRLCSVGISG